jgi:translation initiation factor 3 subunit L
LTLYRELYFRHVYAKLQPTVDDRFQSYENICELFNFLLNSEGPVQLDLPIQWLWDMLDEFVYQFQSFAQWRANPKNKSEEELEMLAEAQQIWSCYSVLNVLYSLVQKSQINEQLRAEKEGRSVEEVAGEYGSKPLYRNLGYFSLICLLRVHVLLGDPTRECCALDASADRHSRAANDAKRRAHWRNAQPDYRLPCHHLLPRRMRLHGPREMAGCHQDVCLGANLLRPNEAVPHEELSIRIGESQAGARRSLCQISKQCDRVYALLAICTTLSPGPSDESIMSTVRERHGEQIAAMQRGGDEATLTFKDLFIGACPKYLSVNPPPYEDPSLLEDFVVHDPTERHVSLFLSDVEAVKNVVASRNLLKLYTSIDAAKLAAFTEGADEEAVLEQLMVLKAASRTYARDKTPFLLGGERISTNNLDFTIEGVSVHRLS